MNNVSQGLRSKIRTPQPQSKITGFNIIVPYLIRIRDVQLKSCYYLYSFISKLFIPYYMNKSYLSLGFLKTTPDLDKLLARYRSGTLGCAKPLRRARFLGRVSFTL